MFTLCFKKPSCKRVCAVMRLTMFGHSVRWQQEAFSRWNVCLLTLYQPLTVDEVIHSADGVGFCSTTPNWLKQGKENSIKPTDTVSLYFGLPHFRVDLMLVYSRNKPYFYFSAMNTHDITCCMMSEINSHFHV